MAVSSRGALLKRRRLGRDFRRHLHEYESRNESKARTEEARRSFLEASLIRATAAPAYRHLVGAGSRDLERYPVTTKQDHAGDPGAYRVQGEGRTVDVATGGSTGNPLLFPATRDGISRQWAVWWRYRRWHGIDIDTWCGYFGGKPVCPIGEREVFWRYNVPGRQVMFSTPHLTPETVERYVAEINRRRLPWLHGLPSTLSLMTAHMEAARLQFGPWLRWITFGSENVPPGAVQDVLRVHGMRASDHYGMAEAVANMSQCPEGRLHVDEDFAHVEFLPYHDDSPDTEPLYRVVGTSFTNPAHAFVRYDTGDLVSGLEDECDCGRPGRTVSRLDGRTASYLSLIHI